MINDFQPIRPILHPTTGDLLQYSIKPKNRNKMRLCDVTKMESRIASLRLYRHARSGDIPQQVVIRELYSYVTEFVNPNLIIKISEMKMGVVVTESVRYEPRKLINNRAYHKAASSYSFLTDLDLQYGLEWQICLWLKDNLQVLGFTGKSGADILDDIHMMPQMEYDRFEYEVATKVPDRVIDWDHLINDFEEHDLRPFIKVKPKKTIAEFSALQAKPRLNETK
jgi:hypothetical protein